MASDPQGTPTWTGEIRTDDLRLLSVEDVCTYLGVSCDYVYDQVRLGNLRCARLARQLRFRRADVDAFIDRHTVGDRADEADRSEQERGVGRRAIRGVAVS
jgi:excisionase family DNA binding protein